MMNKEIKRNPALMAMLGGQEDKETTPKEVKEKKPKKDPRKVNPRGYERNRGKGGTKPMSYYLPNDIIHLIGLKAAQEDKTKSEIVLEGLRYVLREEIKEANKKQKDEKVGEVV